MSKPSKLAVLDKLGVDADAVRAICAAHVVSVDAVLAPPSPSQSRDAAKARTKVWAALEANNVSPVQIARIWNCPISTVQKALERAAKRGAA